MSQERLGGLLSAQLGREQPISGATISRWESNDATPDLATLEALAVVCRVDPGWLAFGERSKAPAPWDRVPTHRLLGHEQRIERELLTESRMLLVEDALRRDKERRDRLFDELRALNEQLREKPSLKGERRAREIVREIDQPGALERLLRDISSDSEDGERDDRERDSEELEGDEEDEGDGGNAHRVER